VPEDCRENEHGKGKGGPGHHERSGRLHGSSSS
jgi:hypothetical protein